MCGRFTLSSSPEAVAELFELAEAVSLPPRYNIAPTQTVPAIVQSAAQPERRLQMLRWGLIPPWANDATIGSRMINARAETVASKPSFRSAFRRRRCLIVADGFYEWQKVQRGKQPFHIRMCDKSPFAFAGLWEHWENAEGDSIDSCTIITIEPNDLLAPLHDRMPVILPPCDYAAWLDPNAHETEVLLRMLSPFPASEMTAYPVSTRVNSPVNDSSECIAPLS